MGIGISGGPGPFRARKHSGIWCSCRTRQCRRRLASGSISPNSSQIAVGGSGDVAGIA